MSKLVISHKSSGKKKPVKIKLTANKWISCHQTQSIRMHLFTMITAYRTQCQGYRIHPAGFSFLPCLYACAYCGYTMCMHSCCMHVNKVEWGDVV